MFRARAAGSRHALSQRPSRAEHPHASIGLAEPGLDREFFTATPSTLTKNSQPMVGGQAGFGYVTMGGMVTVLKVRDGIGQ